MDPLLLMSDTQIKAEIDKLLPEEKAKFDDFASFAEDWHGETGKYEPMDHVMKQLMKMFIYANVASHIIQPEDQPEQGAIEVPPFTDSSSEKALVTAIFPSTDPAVLSYNLKGKAAERKDEEYESIGSESNEEELDPTQIAQIWHDMAKLKREEAALYDKLAKAAPMMTLYLMYSVEKTLTLLHSCHSVQRICTPEWPILTDLEWLWLQLKGWSICTGRTERTLNQSPSKTLPIILR